MPPNNGMHATPLRVPNLGATFRGQRVPLALPLPTGGARNANRSAASSHSNPLDRLWLLDQLL